MADYISGTGSSKAPLFIGIGAVALVIILGVFAFGGSGGDQIAPTTLSEPAPIAGPEAVAPPASDAEAIPN